jgi:hypothetical protein
VKAGTGKQLTWRCRFGHEWVTRGADRVAGKGCPVCSGQRVLPGHNDLQTTHPDLAAQAYGWDPTTVSAGGSVKYGWKCDRGHRWEATIGSRKAGNGCPICSNKNVLPGFNDLSTTHPHLAAQALGWDASTLTAGNDTKKSWRCEFGTNGRRWFITGPRAVAVLCAQARKSFRASTILRLPIPASCARSLRETLVLLRRGGGRFFDGAVKLVINGAPESRSEYRGGGALRARSTALGLARERGFTSSDSLSGDF